MQITLNIDADIADVALQLARSQDRPIEEIILEMARRGMEMSPYVAYSNGLPVLVRPGGGTVTSELVRSIMDEDDDRIIAASKRR